MNTFQGLAGTHPKGKYVAFVLPAGSNRKTVAFSCLLLSKFKDSEKPVGLHRYECSH